MENTANISSAEGHTLRRPAPPFTSLNLGQQEGRSARQDWICTVPLLKVLPCFNHGQLHEQRIYVQVHSKQRSTLVWRKAHCSQRRSAPTKCTKPLFTIGQL